VVFLAQTQSECPLQQLLVVSALAVVVEVAQALQVLRQVLAAMVSQAVAVVVTEVTLFQQQVVLVVMVLLVVGEGVLVLLQVVG